MDREQKKAINQAAKDQKREDKKELKQWFKFIQLMKLKGALIKP